MRTITDYTATLAAGDTARWCGGPTSIVNPAGEVMAQVPLMSTGIVVAGLR